MDLSIIFVVLSLVISTQCAPFDVLRKSMMINRFGFSMSFKFNHFNVQFKLSGYRVSSFRNELIFDEKDIKKHYIIPSQGKAKLELEKGGQEVWIEALLSDDVRKIYFNKIQVILNPKSDKRIIYPHLATTATYDYKIPIGKKRQIINFKPHKYELTLKNQPDTDECIVHLYRWTFSIILSPRSKLFSDITQKREVSRCRFNISKQKFAKTQLK
ncbi:hypothetical protein RF11_14755 [Thelohanellus kitauei]|uniref:Uncharacterized protein n=1 Tax=Thelohanellus kitauei TaxID=669202 RepID=A0A0C2JAS3_THEKT|nr:hypothetical protein RF11_14755 [Thelohanellus kitauei]